MEEEESENGSVREREFGTVWSENGSQTANVE